MRLDRDSMSLKPKTKSSRVPLSKMKACFMVLITIIVVTLVLLNLFLNNPYSWSVSS